MFGVYKSLDEFYAVSTPEDKEIKALKESENKLEIKKLSCALAKKKFEDTTALKKQYLSCTKSCYDKLDVLTFKSSDIDHLKVCKDDCYAPVKDLYTFLDNINFLAEDKMKGCITSCDQTKKNIGYSAAGRQEAFNDCAWVCYNKMERRYQDYWNKQKNDIMRRHGVSL